MYLARISYLQDPIPALQILDALAASANAITVNWLHLSIAINSLAGAM